MRPKKDHKPVRHSLRTEGWERRLNYNKEIHYKEPVIPKPLEYADIDEAFFNFIDNDIDMVYNGIKVPSYKLYSTQRFSEYSQTWQHTDNEGNLLMNFKTVNRQTNPTQGMNQGKLWNIPGDRRYTILMRDVLDDNGTEHYEIYSMKQPFCVDLIYRVNFVTNTFESINEFNMMINEKFKARQCYIRPNGHFIPMVLENINDNTSYTIDERKFFVQSCDIRVMAYIIRKDDFRIDKKPKRIVLFTEGESNRPKPVISLEEYENNRTDYLSLELTVGFEEYHDKVDFNIDTDMTVTDIETDNIRNFRVFVNGTQIYHEKGFKVNDGDNIKIKIRTFDTSMKSALKFIGYDHNEPIGKTEVHENASEDKTRHLDIFVE